MSGTVTRTTDVRPELLAGAFKCRKCLSRVPLVEQQFGYTEPMRCLNPQCKTKGVRRFFPPSAHVCKILIGKLSPLKLSILIIVWFPGHLQSWSLDLPESRFVDWQRVRVQVRNHYYPLFTKRIHAALPGAWVVTHTHSLDTFNWGSQADARHCDCGFCHTFLRSMRTRFPPALCHALST